MDPANSAFQIMHVNNAQAVLSAKPGKINYNCASPIGPNEPRVSFRHEPVLTVSVRPSTMADDATVGDGDHV